MAKKPAARKAVLSRTAARAHGAVLAGLNLAADAQIDLKPVFAGVTARNFAEKKADVWTRAKALAAGKFASDEGATPDDVMMRVLDLVQKEGSPEEAEADETVDAADPATDPNAAAPAEGAPEGEEDDEAKMKALVAKLIASGKTAEDVAKACGMDDGGPAEMNGDPDAEDEEEEEDEVGKKTVTKSAMDAALAATAQSTEARVVARFRAAQEAREFVRPWVGEVSIAFDSAPDIYRAALKSLHVADVDGLPVEALQPILRNLPKPGARQRTEAHLAADASSASAHEELSRLLPTFAAIGLNA